VVPIAVAHPSAWLAVLALPFAAGPVRLVLTRDDPPSLVRALVGTVRFTLVLGLLLTIGLALA
jgi:hypothetical protein